MWKVFVNIDRNEFYNLSLNLKREQQKTKCQHMCFVCSCWCKKEQVLRKCIYEQQKTRRGKLVISGTGYL
jgi:hypothetical protein